MKNISQRMSRRSSRRSKFTSNPLRSAAARVLEPLEGRVLMSGTVSATVTLDANSNGIADPGEPGLAGWNVYVDYNQDGTQDAGEPGALTDSNGVATITNVTAGSTIVREVVPTGYAPAAGFTDLIHLTVQDNRTRTASFLNVTQATTGDITGSVWNDIAGDGVRDPSDPGLAGWTVFIDTNLNHILDAGEVSTTTDGAGNFAFLGMAPGTYNLREVLQPGWATTLGADGKATANVTPGGTVNLSFGNFNAASLGSLKGSVWNDVNADGFRAATDPGIGGWTVFLDLDNNGSLGAGEPSTVTDAFGNYSFPTVTVGTYHVAEVVQSGWTVSPGHPASQLTTVTNEDPGVADFAVFTPVLGSISGEVWNDADGNGAISPGELGVAGVTVFIDQNGDFALNPGEISAVTDSLGKYTLTGVPIGSLSVRDIPPVGSSPTNPGTGVQLVTVQNAAIVSNVNFGNKQRADSSINGTVFVDANGNGTLDPGEAGLSGVTVYLDLNNNGSPDPGEPTTTSSVDLFFTPTINELGSYSFTHLPAGTYHVREVVPALLSATPAAAAAHDAALAPGGAVFNVNFADVYRANEIHGSVFDDANQNHVRDPGEAGIGGVTVYIDANRNNLADPGEPQTVTAADGSYSFTTNLGPGSYVVRALHYSGRQDTYPTTTSGILFPSGVSNPAVGNVSPTSITTSLADGQIEHDTVSLTLPTAGSLSNKVDVFLLFDDTGSFTANSPIVQAAFPQIISALQAAMPGVDFGFGVGRFEEYANFAAEFPTGRPFILNQPIIDQSTPGFSTAIQSALSRTAPGYGGDQPETDIEALYQLATGAGFDGNNNGTTSDSGSAGLVSTQVTPGPSGDVPSFGSFTVDPSGNVLSAAGNIGGAGFRAGALPIVLLATDTGFAFQPMGETSITGVGGITVPISQLTQTSRPTTPFNSGAGIQQTVDALNALGALVIGLGTNGDLVTDPRQDLSSIAELTGAVNHSTTTIPNGTLTPIAPGNPLYFQIASGFGASVANGIVTAVENAASTVSVNVTLRASDPTVHLESTPGVIDNVGSGQTATFDAAFEGDGRPHRFDLQFIRQGTNVVLGSIPVVIGTPIVGEGYEYIEMEPGEIQQTEDFGDVFDPLLPINVAPSYTKGSDENAALNSGKQNVSGWASGISAGPASDAGQVVHFIVSNDNNALFLDQPSISADGTLSYTPAPGAVGSATVTVLLQDSGGTVAGGVNTSPSATFAITVAPINMTLPGTVGNDVYDIQLNGSQLQVFSGGALLNSAALASIGAISFNAGAGNDTLNLMGQVGLPDDILVGSSGVTINGVPLNFTGVEAITFDGRGGADSLTASAGPAVTLATGQRLAALSVGDGGRVALAAGGQALVTQALSVAGTGRLDAADDAIIVDYTGATPLPTIRSWLASGFNAGSWNGAGIGSSTAASDATSSHALGYAEASDLGITTFLGQSVDSTAVLVRYTKYGDNNLDGVIDIGNDFSLFIDGMSSGAGRWINGDYTYDGKVDLGNDFNLFLRNYLAATTPAAPSATPLAARVVSPIAAAAPVVTAIPSALPLSDQSSLFGGGQSLFV
jgi:hypothetical protein